MAKGVKTGGRAAGTPNKATTEFRQTVTALLAKNAANVDLWLQQVADGLPGETDADGKMLVEGVAPDPAKALDLLAKLAEYAAPKLNRTEVAGDPDAPINHSIKVTFE
jgi:hypothetical protein